MSKQLERNILAQFTGTEEYVRYSPLFKKSLLTDGAHYVAETAGAYWLMDAISSHQPTLSNEYFQVWRLVPNKIGNGAMVICEEGNKVEVLTQKNSLY